ncbi:hypothetical protein Y888_18115 [Mixta calida B021323]|jgi:hypothetical protein|nr:hypothetical protein PSNIH2_03600 [Pantoea sp. PSNIH2]KAF0858154.1 hypothetical protein Y888_18115 [Mixta calida B021323]ORM61137.1 hypothetical protein HA40_06240 [Mixta calida]
MGIAAVLIEAPQNAFRFILDMSIRITSDNERTVLFGDAVLFGSHLFKAKKIAVLIGTGVFLIISLEE